MRVATKDVYVSMCNICVPSTTASLYKTRARDLRGDTAGSWEPQDHANRAFSLIAAWLPGASAAEASRLCALPP